MFHCFIVLLYYYRAIDVLHNISGISLNNIFSNVFAMAFILQLPVVFFFFATTRKDFQSCYSFTFQKANPTFPLFLMNFFNQFCWERLQSQSGVFSTLTPPHCSWRNNNAHARLKMKFNQSHQVRMRSLHNLKKEKVFNRWLLEERKCRQPSSMSGAQ